MKAEDFNFDGWLPENATLELEPLKNILHYYKNTKIWSYVIVYFISYYMI